MTSSQTIPSICDACQRIIFAYLLNNPILDRCDKSLGISTVLSENCDLCATLPAFQPGQEVELKAVSYTDHVWTPPTGLGAFSNILLCIAESKIHGQWQEESMNHVLTNLVLCIPRHGKEEHAPWKPHPLSETPDYEAARAWVAHCQDHQGPTCNDSPLPCLDGMLLVDVYDSQIVQVDGLITPRWIALSYVWSDKSQYPPSVKTKSNKLPNLLPRTISDAIMVTKELGYRYLWVDELCIDQEDYVHRNSQIALMDQIYQGADLVIAAACGDSKDYGLPGVSSTPRIKNPVFEFDQATVISIGPDPLEDVDRSIWFSRAWTFQEAYLARRLLVFSDHQMTYYCRRTGWMEAMDGPSKITSDVFDIDMSNIWTFLWSLSERGTELALLPRPIVKFQDTLSEYIRRKISYDSDKLNAAAGILHHFGQGDYPVYNFAGLPYYRGNKDSAPLFTAEEAIIRGISWYSLPKESDRVDIFPSWTWAGWKSEVWWSPLLPSRERMYMHSVHLENGSGQILSSHEHLSDRPTSALQQQLNAVTALLFEGSTVPAECFDDDIFAGKASGWSELSEWALTQSEEKDGTLVRKLREGLWSCFALPTQHLMEPAWLGVLVCRWIDGHTAERLGAVQLGLDSVEALEALEACFETRRVRLV